MCIAPITINVQPGKYGPFRSIQVPCGKCQICRSKYQNSWTIRIVEELKVHKYTTFFTLTYRPENVPYTCNRSTGEAYMSVCKKHIQDWLKRFRTRYYRNYGKKLDFKYFICSELGPRTLRPHYHGLFFGLSLDDCRLALDDWCKTFGYITARPVNNRNLKEMLNSGRYVGKYCSKGQFETPLIQQGKTLPMFRLISKGLGLSYVEKQSKYHLSSTKTGDRIGDICRKSFYFLNDNKYALPRYYKDKIYGQQSLLRTKIANYLLAVNDELYREKLRELSATMSENEAVNYLVRQENDVLRNRHAELTQRYSSFLNKSKI